MQRLRAHLRFVVVLLCMAGLIADAAACRGTSPSTPTPNEDSPAPPGNAPQPVYVAVFTHIEDNTPAGTLGSAQARAQYLNLRTRLVEMAELARRYGIKYSLQPDWKYLEAARLYEDASTMATTGGVNVFRYLRDSLAVSIDPHSHENGGYNYTDVAYLLQTLGVGGSTVIGGHIWDPSIPQFQHWDRFRMPVSGQRYPQAVWRGDILMGSGSPNHVNDPIVSGVWRPRDANNYWVDDPFGNIAAIGAFKGDIAGISELLTLSRNGQIAASCMMTATLGATPSTLLAPGGLSTIESTIAAPLAALGGQVVSTDFTSLVNTWRGQYSAQGCTYRQ